MSSDFGLTVRRHERHQLSLGALVLLGATAQPGTGGAIVGAVRFSSESGVSDHGLHATVVDLGAGGLGVRTSLFLPRGSVIRVKILDDSGNMARPRLEAVVRIQRITMTDRKPTYLLGTSFVDPSPAFLKQVQELIAIVNPPIAAAAGGAA